MREYLFRGKRKDNGEWIKGDLLQYLGCGKVHIAQNYKGAGGQEVLPETVGQYTGLTDKKGVKVFEDDIVHAVYKTNYVGVPDNDWGLGIIEYDETEYGGARYHMKKIGDVGSRIFSASVEIEIIGNIYDNPELLKGGAEE